MRKHETESGDQVELSQLLAQFYASTETLGKFTAVENAPAPFDQLLDHHSHMTVTVEAFHQDSVDVVVHRSRSILDDGSSVWQNDTELASEQRVEVAKKTLSYSREITLKTHREGAVVQYGIVRLDPSALRRDVWLKIAGGEVPLGRVLIENNVLREVSLCQLWEVQPGVALRSLMRLPTDQTIYGRTALIRCDDQPAIELLEIVSEQPNA